ncbi:hypothetical protein GQ53DRAFT_740554 [Thozetella sp. PMI_491]|nr:hypothetical protein GQ53DRAFT_740554 [Thozetella sp. PMI_491]
MKLQRASLAFVIAVSLGGITLAPDISTLGLLLYCTTQFQKNFAVGYISVGMAAI